MLTGVSHLKRWLTDELPARDDDHETMARKRISVTGVYRALPIELPPDAGREGFEPPTSPSKLVNRRTSGLRARSLVPTAVYLSSCVLLVKVKLADQRDQTS